MTRTALLLAATAALAGCAGDNTPPPAIQIQTVVEKVPVPVPCVKREDIAPEPGHVAGQLTGKAGHDLLVVDQSALELRTWGEVLQAQLLACSTPGETPKP